MAASAPPIMLPTSPLAVTLTKSLRDHHPAFSLMAADYIHKKNNCRSYSTLVRVALIQEFPLLTSKLKLPESKTLRFCLTLITVWYGIARFLSRPASHVPPTCPFFLPRCRFVPLM